MRINQIFYLTEEKELEELEEEIIYGLLIMIYPAKEKLI